MGTRELRGNNSDAGHWLHLGANPRDWRTHGRNEAKAPAFASVRHGEVTSRLFYESQCAAVDRIEVICEQHPISGNFRRLDGLLCPAMGADAKKTKKRNGLRRGAVESASSLKEPDSLHSD
jgi:hypothetical protein